MAVDMTDKIVISFECEEGDPDEQHLITLCHDFIASSAMVGISVRHVAPYYPKRATTHAYAYPPFIDTFQSGRFFNHVLRHAKCKFFLYLDQKTIHLQFWIVTK